GAFPMSEAHLHASPGAPLTRGEAAWMLARVLAPAELERPAEPIFDVWQGHPYLAAARTALGRGWMILDHPNWVHAEEPLYWGDVRFDRVAASAGRDAGTAPLDRFRPVTRGEFSGWLAGLLP